MCGEKPEINVKIEDGISEEILEALQDLSSVERAKFMDRNVNRFDFKATQDNTTM